MENFALIRKKYPDWEPAYPLDWPKPSLAEINRIQNQFSIKYPEEFIEFQINESQNTPMGDFAFDNFGWAESSLGPMENLFTIVEDAQEIGIPNNLAPFKCDNSDYYCFNENGNVVIWDHNSNMIEKDPNYI